MKYEIRRTKGETKTHVYFTTYGYPIRACTWTQPENDFIDNGNAELCKNCSDYLHGKRKIAFAPKVEVDK
jgi:anaerobic ribonucleoside-triphosphate reductase